MNASLSSALQPASPPRKRDWQPLLAALPAAHLERALEPLRARWSVDELQPAQAGLGLLQLPDSVQHQPWFAGEIPVARCRVRVRDPEGRDAEGGAILLDDRAARARDLAICDAVFAGRLDGHEALLELLDEGRRRLREQQRERQTLRQKTRVDFGALGGVSGEDDD